MPKISVIIPTYNAEATILETIESLQQQTFQDFEILVINDGSTDRTLEVLNHINEPRLKILSYENAGHSVARNRGIAVAQGEFLSFMDADDLWTPDKLESQLTALEQHPDAGVAYSWTLNMTTQDGQTFFTKGCSSTVEGNVYRELLLGCFIGNGSNILIRRSVVDKTQGFEPGMKTGADWDFYIRAATECNFVVVPKPQILYRQTPGSVSSNPEATERNNLALLDRVYQAAPPEFQYLKSQSLAYLYRYCAGLSLVHITDQKQLNYAQERLWMAVQLYPPLLLERYAQNLIIKLLVKRLLPDTVSQSVLSVLKKPFSQRDPRVQ